MYDIRKGYELYQEVLAGQTHPNRANDMESLLGWSSKGLRCYVAAISTLAFGASAEPATPGCQRTMIAMFVSPDDAWIARVQEEVCESPGIATTGISDIVQLVRGAEKPDVDGDVFAIEEHGDPANRPILQWLSPQKLQITVPNKSLIGLRKSSYEGIDIIVKFEPDDPAERERWLKSLGLPTR